MTLLCSLLTLKDLRQGLAHSRDSVNICDAGDQRPWMSPELLPESQDLESQAGLKGWGRGRGNVEPPFSPPRPLVTLSPISLCSLAISPEETQSPVVFLHHRTHVYSALSLLLLCLLQSVFLFSAFQNLVLLPGQNNSSFKGQLEAPQPPCTNHLVPEET